MAISSVASQMGITASPVAAAVTTFMAMTAKSGAPVSLGQILMVTIPAGIVGVLAAALWSMTSYNYFFCLVVGDIAIAVSAIGYLSSFVPWFGSTPIHTCIGVIGAMATVSQACC